MDGNGLRLAWLTPGPGLTSKQFPILRGFNLEAAERMA